MSIRATQQGSLFDDESLDATGYIDINLGDTRSFGGGRLYTLSLAEDGSGPPRWRPTVKTATPKQASFIMSLARRKLRSFSSSGVDLLSEEGILQMERSEASALIDELLALPDAEKTEDSPRQQGPDEDARARSGSYSASGLDLSRLRGGFYAATLDGVTKFFKIDVVAEGKWEGWVFVKIQASDDLHRQGSQKPGQAYRGSSQDYLAEIARDEQAAMELYGREIGRCGHCGRTLTNEESRARGIGPVCAEKMGW